MRRGTVVVLLLWAAGLAFCLQREAQAADFYSNRKLLPGADGGTTALASLLDAGIGTGNQFMIRCESYDVTYKLCKVATCTAGADDKYVPPGRDYDICGLNSYEWLSVYRPFDGGVPTCRLYNVSPQSKDCQP